MTSGSTVRWVVASAAFSLGEDFAHSSAANAEMRKFARATIELAQAVKHSRTPTRTEAGILADAVVLLANMLRRLDEERSVGI